MTKIDTDLWDMTTEEIFATMTSIMSEAGTFIVSREHDITAKVTMRRSGNSFLHSYSVHFYKNSKEFVTVLNSFRIARGNRYTPIGYLEHFVDYALTHVAGVIMDSGVNPSVLIKHGEGNLDIVVDHLNKVEHVLISYSKDPFELWRPVLTPIGVMARTHHRKEKLPIPQTTISFLHFLHSKMPHNIFIGEEDIVITSSTISTVAFAKHEDGRFYCVDDDHPIVLRHKLAQQLMTP